MNYKIVIIDDAKAEYKKSFFWYKDINPIVAKRFYSSFKECISIIRKKPLLFQIRYDDVKIIVFPTFPYLIHYRIHKNRIVIESICHSSKDGKLNIF